MDGRIPALGLTILLPAILLVVTIGWFASNPVAVLVLFGWVLLGCLYYTTYLGPASSSSL